MKTTIETMKQAKNLFEEIYQHDDQHAFDARKGTEILTAAIAREEAQTVRVINWQEAPRRIEFGDRMVITDIALGADHTATIFCEESVKDLAAALFTHPAPPPSGERAELIEDCSTYAKVGVSQEARRLVRRCADMLAADADAYEQGRYDEEMRQGPPQSVWDEMAADAQFKPGSSTELNAIQAVVMCIGGVWPAVDGDPYTLHHVKRMARELQAFYKADAKPPIAFLPSFELERLNAGHNANVRSAKFGPSKLDGDVALYLKG